MYCSGTSRKKCYQYNKNGNFINEYDSISEAARTTKICRSNISLCCNNILETAGGYIWKLKKVI